ncbi:tripartite motif-containing protein 2-like [Branchiostoma lanceolatum]|uniref:tripartite motif-containing protein 2-like n=1 Tax=Branchiostoma lanceolatum TaxID=7740 RepID=UPI0034535848
MASNAMSEITEEFLVCQVCLEDFKQPKMLPCLHTFCQPCLERLLATEPVGKLDCPTCRQDVPLPQNGVQGLKSNYLVGKLHNILQKQPKGKGLTSQPPENAVTCTACEAGDSAQFYCVECTDYLCQTCNDAHSRLRATRSHNVRTVAELKSGGLPIKLQARKTSKCVAHNELHKFYCDTCHWVICLHCVVTAHKDHQYVEVEKVAERERAELSRVQAAADLHEKWIEKLRSVEEEWSSQVQRAEEQIEEQERTIIEAVKKVKNNRISQLHAMHDTRKKQMEAAIEAAEMDLASAKSCVQFTGNVLDYGSPAEFMSVAGRTEQSADKKIVEKAEMTKGFMNLTFDSQARDVEEELLKMMVIKQQAVPMPNALMLARPKVASTYRQLKVIDNYGGKSRHGRDNLQLQSLVVTAAGDIAVADNGNLQFFGRDGSFQIERTVHLGWRLCCLGVLATGELLATGDGHTIHVLDKQNRRRIIQVTGVAEELQRMTTDGIAVDGMGRIVVNVVYEVFVLNSNGDTMLKFGEKGNDYYGLQQGLRFPVRIAVNSNNQIIICSRNSMKIFDPTGHNLFSVGARGSGPGQLDDPQSVTTDNDDNIIVADMGAGSQNRDSRVSLFSRDGTFIRDVLTKKEHGLESPSGLALTHDGHLVVSEGNSLKIFVPN